MGPVHRRHPAAHYLFYRDDRRCVRLRCAVEPGLQAVRFARCPSGTRLNGQCQGPASWFLGIELFAIFTAESNDLVELAIAREHAERLLHTA